MSGQRPIVLALTALYWVGWAGLLWAEDRRQPRIRDLQPLELPSEPVVDERPRAPDDAANVVLVVMSTQRRDQWSVYGGPATTPFLAARAAEGAVMADAVAVAVSSAPAMSSILVGRWPHGLGTVDRARRDRVLKLRDDAETLAERFAGAGWYTIGLTAAAELGLGRNANQGFAEFSDRSPGGTTAAELVAEALEQVARRPGDAVSRPLFLLVVLNDSRTPTPTAADGLTDPKRGWVGPYRASILRQDAAVASLVSGLADQGLDAANTVFVVLADHGEGLDMPPRHRMRHGIVLYDSSASIPWLWWGRGITPGTKVTGLASQVDLAPTLAALAGLGPFDGDGLDLSEVVRSGGATSRTEAYADTLMDGFDRASLWTADRQCQQDYGSVNRPADDDFVAGCFDRQVDPKFFSPLPPSVATTELSNRLDTLHAERLREIPSGPPGAPR